MLPITNETYEWWEADGGRRFSRAWAGLTDEQRGSVTEIVKRACIAYKNTP